MQSKRSRLDRFISRHIQIPKKQVRLLLAQGRVKVDGVIARDIDLQIDQFNHIICDGLVLQQRQARYIMLNKPVGVVCATKDDKHRTVIDLINEAVNDAPNSNQSNSESSNTDDLHIVGRLDLNTSGLVLLTNDSQWSKGIMSPDSKVDKIYVVTLKNPIDERYIQAFEEGFYFAYEDITTLPAKLEIISSHCALVTLQEGRYHQIKRMFGRFRNPVIGLHRLSVGDIRLDESLLPGQSRQLTATEMMSVGGIPGNN
ncbi:16S rRNA pseudouridine(516) synthase [Shewanella psychrotolerans]|uniref:16S rRNA pseudouridine(516) synthase n=1 Tax=Shewanella psychrotolerans TaxID=2864206 RepID=UPI001C65C916|nr:16S rRNA pseudouridine(516) synthase [Shewanella psychrotolerans]QYK02189.1 16S rRNA pseudouridine(516) synthase [Shewanella psychrotolerans]